MMLKRRIIEMITRAVLDGDTPMLDRLAEQLANSECANQILRSKGWGESGQTIDATARLVPHARYER